MQHIDLNDTFQRLWRSGDLFEQAFAVHGKIFRQIKNRTTIRFVVNDRPYFIKLHRGVGWREIFKNLFQFKRPVLGASNEYLAIRKFETIGLHTMTACAFAERGFNPASRESFLVTEELAGKVSLEDFCRNWAVTPPASTLKHRLCSELARVCGIMHAGGINHRDCYLCHFLLDKTAFKRNQIELFVLDLHRAEIRSKIPRRMRIKDLAGIFFSSMDLGLSRRDALRFMAVYGKYNHLDSRVWGDVLTTAVKLYRKEYHRSPPPAK